MPGRGLALTIAIGLSIAGVLAVDLMLVTQRGVTTPVNLADTLDRFRRETPARSAGTPPSSPRSSAGRPSPARSDRAKRSTTTRPRTATQTSRFRPPTEGVYAYRTDGYESISTGSARHDYPSESYVTVRRRGCGWEFVHRVIKEHVDTNLYCTSADRHALASATTAVTFFGQSGTRTYTCDPPLTLLTRPEREGSVFTGSCTTDDGKARSDDHVTVLGFDAITIGGAAVSAVRIVDESTLSGETEGRGRIEMWLDAASGLPLRFERDFETRTSSGFGTVTYTEHAAFALESMTPQT